MSSAYLRRVSNRTVEGLLADPSRVHNVLFPSSTETVIDDEVLITIAAWELVDRALDAGAFLGRGGTPIGDAVVGDGPARGFSAAEVRKIATKLALTTEASVAASLDQATPAPGAGPTAEALADYTIVKDFVTESAKAEAAMIVYLG